MTRSDEHQRRTEHGLSTAGKVLSYTVVLLILFGPPVYAMWIALSGAPLYATETITMTRPHGIVVEAGAVLLPWGMVLFIGWLMATDRIPSFGGGY